MATVEIGGLSHLVEAATTLANLDWTKNGNSTNNSNPSKDDTGAQQQMQTDNTSSALDNNSTMMDVCETPPASTTAPPSISNSETGVHNQQTAAPGSNPKPTNTTARPSNKSSTPASNVNKREIFPQRLLTALNDESLSDTISWLPHGRSFVIIRPDVFTEKVMPKYFPPIDSRGSTKYPSFTRKLNRWGFRQATRGPDTGAFHHPLFQRDHPELCVDMVCQRSRSASSSNNNTSSVSPSQKNGASTTGGSSFSSNHRKTPSAKETSSKNSVVHVAPLTKESIAKILPTPTPPSTGFGQTPATVSVDETRSVTSNTSSSSNHPAPNDNSSTTSSDSLPANLLFKRGITTDKVLVDSTIRQRDEMERMRVAQALLYKAFTSALQEQISSGTSPPNTAQL